MKIKTVHRLNPRKTRIASKNYGDDKIKISIPVKCYVADTGRAMSRMKKLLCMRGERSDGECCKGCESSCRFGEEYAKMKDKEGEDEGEKGNARA